MKCANHLLRDVAGYCTVCGTFGCEKCLVRHEGELYCKRHYKPIAERIETDFRRQELRKRHGRHHLVVRYKDGSARNGICMNFNLRDTKFFLEHVDENWNTTEKTIMVRFQEIKAVCNVRTDADRKPGPVATPPGGSHIVVEFKDGEIVEGYTQHPYDPDEARFFLLPVDSKLNYISMLVERSALARVYKPDEYAAIKEQQDEARKQSEAESIEETAELTQEESMGDFYFEQHNYAGAWEQFRLAEQKFPGSPRLRHKMTVAAFNIGVQHMKKRDYRKALSQMEKALELDPGNKHAKKKAHQLRKVIDKTERRMREYEKQRVGRDDPDAN